MIEDKHLPEAANALLNFVSNFWVSRVDFLKTGRMDPNLKNLGQYKPIYSGIDATNPKIDPKILTERLLKYNIFSA